LRDGSYNGGWFIPPRELLTEVETGILSDTFRKVVTNISLRPSLFGLHEYWSSTEYRDDPSCVWCASFTDGYEFRSDKNGLMEVCRPVRLELTP